MTGDDPHRLEEGGVWRGEGRPPHQEFRWGGLGDRAKPSPPENSGEVWPPHHSRGVKVYILSYMILCYPILYPVCTPKLSKATGIHMPLFKDFPNIQTTDEMNVTEHVHF